MVNLEVITLKFPIEVWDVAPPLALAKQRTAA